MIDIWQDCRRLKMMILPFMPADVVKMMLSKKEKLNIVAAMMQNHEQLCPDVFNPDFPSIGGLNDSLEFYRPALRKGAV